MKSLGLLLLVLPFAWMLLVSAPALSQTSPGGPSAAGAQYGDDVSITVGESAAHDAMMASGAIRAASEEAQATETDTASASEVSGVSGDLDAASAAEEDNGTSSESPSASESAGATQDESASTGGAQDESASAAFTQGEIAKVSDLEKLPNTGGPSPLWIGLPLVCAGGLLARRAFSNYGGFHVE